MGHLWILCGTCDQEGRQTVLYEPPHNVTHRAPGPWQPPRQDPDA